jgi:hypothetical protein
MKQRVTIGQINKLKDEQKERLRVWWNPVYGDFFSNGHWENIIQSAEDDSIRCVSTDNDGAYDYESKKECLPLLSIGQMIEIIEYKKPLKSISKARFDKWIVNIETSTLGYKDELCDSLWETVTRIL